MNVKFVLEGMEEAGSVALEELVKREKDGFFSRVDCIVISDNLWLSQRPALIYGTRGNSYFTVEVYASRRGGAQAAPAWALSWAGTQLWERGEFSWALGLGHCRGLGSEGVRGCS